MRVKGTELTSEDQQYVLRAFRYRFTGDHKPDWAKKPMNDGKPYPVQFASDQDWLEHSTWQVRKDGRLDRRVKSCFSSPTWPDNPELRL